MSKIANIKMGLWQGRSLATKIAVFAMALTTLTTAAVGGVALYLIKNLRHESIEVALRHELTTAVHHFETVLGDLHNLQAGLSTNSLLANALVDSQGRNSYLEPFIRDFADSLPAAVVVSLADFKGRRIATGEHVSQGGGADSDVEAVIVGGRPIVWSLGDGTDQWRLRMVHPVVYPATGRAEGALIFDVNLPSLVQEARGRLGPASRMMLVHGLPIATDAPDELRMQAPLSLPASLASLGFSVVVQRSRSVLTDAVVELTVYGLGVAMLVFVIAWYASAILAARIVAPLTRLGDFARLINDGSIPDVGSDLMSDDTEVGRVSRSLALLISRLRGNNVDLAKAVDERTRQLTTSESRMRAVVDNVADAIITIDAAGTIETFNHAAERMFGYSAEEIVGKGIGLLMPEPHRSASGSHVRAYFESADTGPALKKREIEGQRRDGSVFPIDLALSEMVVPEGRRVIGIVRDITERQRLDQLKSDFVSTVSHELRTPLTSIRGSLGLMLSGHLGTLELEIRQMAELSLRNSDRLLSLINDILDVQKIESGKMSFNFAMHEVNALLDQCIEANQGLAAASGVPLRVVERCPAHQVYVDPARFVQVISNLISNAVKFTASGTTVEMGCREVDGEIWFLVRDQGPGIPTEFAAKVFQKFSQADASSSRQKSGTGLGLNISKQIIDRLSGRIWYECPASAGTVFLVALPTAALAYDAARVRARAAT